MALALRLASGDGAGTLIPVGQSLIIGRDSPPPANLMGDASIAARQAEIRPQGKDGALISDLDTANRTVVNGRRITGPTLLAPGDRVQFGVVTAEVVVYEPTDPSATVVTPLPAWQTSAAQSSAATATRSRRTPLIAVGLVVLLAALFTIGYFVGNSGKSSSHSHKASKSSAFICASADSGRSGAGHFRFNTSACEDGRLVVDEFRLPLHKGVSKGKTVWYVIMDTSDQATSARLGVNYVPKLNNAKGTKAVQKVTVSADGVVNFPGTVDFNHHRKIVPGPTGFPPAAAEPPSVADPLYSPLIQLPSGVVENAPQIANSSGKADKVVSLDTKHMNVIFRAQHGFYENKSVHYASFDASDPGVAAVEDVTYAPNLNAAPKPNDEDLKTSAREMLIAFVNGPDDPGSPLNQGVNLALLTGGPNPTPLNLLHETPVLANHADVGALEYTPLWDVHLAEWTQAAIDAGDRTQYRDVDTVLDNLVKAAPGAKPLVTGPGGKPFGAAGVIVNCPLVSIDIP